MKTCLVSALLAIATLLSLATLSVSADSLVYEDQRGTYGIGRAEFRASGADVATGAGRVHFPRLLSDSVLLDVRDDKLETRYERWVYSPDMVFLNDFAETDPQRLAPTIRYDDVFGVPVPHAVFLFGAALVGLVAVARPRSIKK